MIPPLTVEFVNVIVIFSLEPLCKGFLAQLAVAFARIFVGDVPHFHRRVAAVAFCQNAVHVAYLFTVNGTCQTVIVAYAEFVADTVFTHLQHFGVFVGKPVRSCTGRGGKDGINAVFVHLSSMVSSHSKL